METIDRRAPLRHSTSSPNVRYLQKHHQGPQRACEANTSLFLPEFEKRQAQNYDNQLENYACNICFEVAENAVVTGCGHLHCWSCLYQWMTLPSQIACPTCPVCKSSCELATLTPIYGRGESSVKDTAPRISDKQRTLSCGSQSKPKNILDQWLTPHIYPPTLPVLPKGQTPARPVARRQQQSRKQAAAMYTTSHSAPHSIFGNTHPVVIFSAGITTLCGMQILNNGGFTAPSDFQSDDNTSRMMWALGCRHYCWRMVSLSANTVSQWTDDARVSKYI